eukprot:1877311-Pleurochrysis_carterae.AAC.2
MIEGKTADARVCILPLPASRARTAPALRARRIALPSRCSWPGHRAASRRASLHSALQLVVRAIAAAQWRGRPRPSPRRACYRTQRASQAHRPAAASARRTASPTAPKPLWRRLHASSPARRAGPIASPPRSSRTRAASPPHRPAWRSPVSAQPGLSASQRAASTCSSRVRLAVCASG